MTTPTVLQTDIAIAGGGSGGTAAAIAAARAGAKVVLVEETPWLGGMLTSAGVVAFDGNYGPLTCGFYREIVREIEIHYGGPAKTEPGWVTRTAFEPAFLASTFEKLTRRETNISLFLKSRVTEVSRSGNQISGFRFVDDKGAEFDVQARIVIDATEYGDLINMGNIPFRFGRESREMTGEPDAPETADLEIQDVTYVAILQDFQATDSRNGNPVPPSPDYDPALFRGATVVDSDAAENHDHVLHTWETFIDYGRLPNHKFMINWPFHANDFPDALACFDRGTREKAYIQAREHTLNFVHYMQTTLEHPELGIADDEFPTPDGLPFIPYVRETRRILGDVIMREQDVLPAYGNGVRPPVQKTSIACGDYFLDHHHARAHPGHPQFFHEKYQSNATFQVPAGVFFPAGIDGFMAVEKSISVTHIVNGCTRLQPIVLLLGEAAGVIAAMAIRDGIEPRAVGIRDVQEYLLLREVTLFCYTDLYPYEREFLEAQKLALAGVIPDNETFIYAKDKPVTWELAAQLLVKADGGTLLPEGARKAAFRQALLQWARIMPEHPLNADSAVDLAANLSRLEIAPILCAVMGIAPVDEVTIRFLDYDHRDPAARFIEPLYHLGIWRGIWHMHFKPDALVKRWELTLMIDRAFDPFRRLPLHQS